MYIVILITVGTRHEGLKIARALVEEGLAACVNIAGGIDSVYRWEGKVEEGREWLLIAKTEGRLLGRVTARVRELHSYEMPEIIALRVEGGYQRYLDWLGESVAAGARAGAGAKK